MPADIAPSPITAIALPGLPAILLATAKPSAAEIEVDECAAPNGSYSLSLRLVKPERPPPVRSVRAYRWAFGDGAIAAGRRIVLHRYRGTKTRYTVTLIVTDDASARGEIRRSISVRPGSGDVSVAESIVVADAPEITPPGVVDVTEPIGVTDAITGLIPPSSIDVIETIGASDGTAPVHNPSPRRLSNQRPRRER